MHQDNLWVVIPQVPDSTSGLYPEVGVWLHLNLSRFALGTANPNLHSLLWSWGKLKPHHPIILSLLFSLPIVTISGLTLGSKKSKQVNSRCWTHEQKTTEKHVGMAIRQKLFQLLGAFLKGFSEDMTGWTGAEAHQNHYPPEVDPLV